MPRTPHRHPRSDRSPHGGAIGRRLALLAGALLGTCAAGARADLEVRFVESAPKDRFELTNVGPCPVVNARLLVDLSGSVGRLIFDTTAEGAGVEVFQPFEVASGSIALDSAADVVDGDTGLALRIVELAPGDSAGFTIDLDDTLPDGELGMIRVTGAEIGGATLVLENVEGRAEAIFGHDARARVRLEACSSP